MVAFSSGNHAQAISLAATLLGMPAVIVMPHDAPAAKVAATKGYGAAVVVYDRYREDREAIGRKLAEERGMTLIPPYDHPDVIAGQGTAAKELIEEVGALDALFVCLGGGGLLAGSALAARALAPACKVYGVEPEAGNDGQQSFRSGRIVTIETPRTIADGAQTLHLGEHTFPIIRRDVADIFTATDAELVAAMRFFAERMKMIVEPTGTLGFAAARRMPAELAGQARRHPDQRRQRRPVALRRARRRRRGLSDARRRRLRDGVPSPYTDFGLPARRIDGLPRGRMHLQIATRHVADAVIAMPVGRIDHRSAADFEAALTPLVTAAAAAKGALVLDFSGDRVHQQRRPACPHDRGQEDARARSSAPRRGVAERGGGDLRHQPLRPHPHRDRDARRRDGAVLSRRARAVPQRRRFRGAMKACGSGAPAARCRSP